MPEHGTADRILDAVVEILGSRGLEGVTIRDVAKTAGFSVGAVQHHFPTKQLMLVAALDQASDSVIANYDRALEDVSDPVERLRTGLTMLAAVGQIDRPAAVLWTAIASQSAVDPEIRAGFTRMQRGIRQWISALITDAFPTLTAPDHLATVLVAAAQGAMIATVSEDDGDDREQSERMINQLLRAVLSEQAQAPSPEVAR